MEATPITCGCHAEAGDKVCGVHNPQPEPLRKTDFAARDIELGKAFLDAFIKAVNDDHMDLIPVSRTTACYMRDEIERLRKAAGESRETQHTVSQWCRQTFPEFQGLTNRAIAVVEEAVELALEAGMSSGDIRRTVNIPIRKERERRGSTSHVANPENLREEVADVLLTLYPFAEEAGISAQDALDAKMRKNRARPLAYYREKTRQKQELGMPLVPKE